MSNVQHITAMTKAERLAVILTAYGDNPELLEQAKAGIEQLARKEKAAARLKHLPHVVHRSRVSQATGQPVVVHEYLGEDFIPGSMNRRWTDAYGAAQFHGVKDATRARHYNGEGRVIPQSSMPIPGDVLGRSDTGRGIEL
jgi:hypothetical protein